MKPIYISKTNLPSLTEYNKFLKRIWKSNWVTNDGQLVQELERKLREYWGVKHVICVANGTLAIEIALKALDIKKEIYLSPLSFVATASAPLWLGIKPRFIDLDEEYKSPALVTHVYGALNPTKARPVIYDASHVFPIKEAFSLGGISIVSFHATKLFHTIEGGAIVTNNDGLAEKARWLRNFGFKTQYSFYGVGINAKMNELEAAMGLCLLPKVDKVFKKYTGLIKRYDDALGVRTIGKTYYPFLYETEKALEKAKRLFEENQVYPRRYFYPPLNKVFGGRRCPQAEDFSRRVLCLPLFYDLTNKEQDRIIKIAQKTL